MINLFPVLRNESGKTIWTQDQIHFIVNHYNQYHSTHELVEICGVSAKVIRNQLRKQKIKILTNTEVSLLNNPRDSYYFSKIDSQDKAYWLGFLMADGYNNEKHHSIRINLQKSDENHLRKFLRALQMDENRIKYQTKDNKFEIAYITITDKQLSKDLARCGCIQRKSNVLKFPTEEIVPKNLQSDFIRGYFDGDGSISYSKKNKSTNRLYFQLHILGTKDFLISLRKILNKEYLALEKRTDTLYSFNLCGNKNVLEFSMYIYNNSNKDIELTRKKDKFDLLKLQQHKCR